MSFEDRLSQKRATIVKKWFEFILHTYPPETANLMRKEANQFANPVGYTIFHGMEDLFDELLKGGDPEKISTLLDGIVRIRAVQDFAPSKAVSFLPELKRIVREVLEEDIRENRITADDFAPFEVKVDGLLFLAFDIYTQCREKLYELKLNELKSRTFRLLQKADLLAEVPWEDTKSKKKRDN
jgi:hypothetical protein